MFYAAYSSFSYSNVTLFILTSNYLQGDTNFNFVSFCNSQMFLTLS